MFQKKDAVDLTQLGAVVFFSDPVDVLVPELVCSNDTFPIVETFLADRCSQTRPISCLSFWSFSQGYYSSNLLKND